MDILSLEFLNSIRVNSDSVFDVIPLNEKKAVIFSFDRTIKVVDLEKGNVISTTNEFRVVFGGITIPEKNLVVSEGEDHQGTLAFFTLEDLNRVSTLKNYSELKSINLCYKHIDESHFAIGSYYGSVSIVNWKTRECFLLKNSFSSYCWSIDCFKNRPGTIVACGEERVPTIKVFNWVEQKVLYTFKLDLPVENNMNGSQGTFYSVVTFIDRIDGEGVEKILSCSNEIIIWNPETPENPIEKRIQCPEKIHYNLPFSNQIFVLGGISKIYSFNLLKETFEGLYTYDTSGGKGGNDRSIVLKWMEDHRKNELLVGLRAEKKVLRLRVMKKNVFSEDEEERVSFLIEKGDNYENNILLYFKDNEQKQLSFFRMFSIEKDL